MDDYVTLPWISPNALRLAAECVGRAALLLGPAFPPGAHPVEGPKGPNGSLIVNWNAPSGRHVRAIFGDNAYLYREWSEFPPGHEVEDDVTKLAEWLEWLRAE